MSIQASTNSVFFYDIHKQPSQMQTVMLTNVALKPLRVRVTPPKTANFSIEFYNLPIVAPGMSLPLYVTLKSSGGDAELADYIVVKTYENEQIIRIKATSVFSCIEAHDIDFGLISTGTAVSKKLTIRNSGNDIARYEIKCSLLYGEASFENRSGENQLIISEPKGEIPPFSYVELNVYMLPARTSTVLALMEINQLQHKVTATITEPKIVLTYNGKLVTSAYFYALFYQSETQEFELCNVSPFYVNFDTNVRIIAFKCQTEAENDYKLMYMLGKQVQVIPSKGILKPNSASPVRVKFAPYQKLEKTEQINLFMQHCGFYDWQRILNGVDYDKVLHADDETLKRYGSEYAMFRPGIDDLMCYAEIEFYGIFRSIKQESQVLKIYCQARRPLFVFSYNTFSFSRGQTYHLEVKSMNHYPCAVTFEVPCGFKLNSEATVLFQAKESRIFELAYMPNSLSDFNGYLHAHCGNEYFNVNLPLLVNKDAGERKIIETTVAYVDSGVEKPQISVQEMQSKTLKELRNRGFASSLDMDRSYNRLKKEQTYKISYVYRHLAQKDDSESSAAGSCGEIDVYNDYIDLGMAEDMYMPNDYDFRINAKIKDKTQRQINQNIDLCDYSSYPKRRPALNNDQIPTNKIYTYSQFDQVQFNKIAEECTNKLLAKQFSIITTGTHEFDFGDVTVGTVATKYFKIANDLQMYIKVELSHKVREDEKTVCYCYLLSNPQYLPPGCYTSFGIKMQFVDIYDSFYDTIEVLINSQLYTTLSLQASIKRPYLKSNVPLSSLSAAYEIIARVNKAIIQPKYDTDSTRDCLFFALTAENAFDKHICYTLTLSNIGTSDTVVYLQLQSACMDLALEHAEIAIPQGVTMECKIEWIPYAYELTSNLLELSFLKGASYFLPIVCKLNPGAINILEKSLDLGLVNVSQYITSTLTLQNKNAQFPLFYEIMVDYFNYSQNFLKLYIDVSKGEIGQEETLPVQFVFTALNLGYFSVPLTLRIIGGLSYSITVKGSVETAYIYIEKYSAESLMQSIKSNISYPSSKDTSKAQSRLYYANSIILPEAEIALSNIVMNLTYYQKLSLVNKGKVAVGMFIDASFANGITLYETQDNNVLFKQYTRKEMLEMFYSFKGEVIWNEKAEIGLQQDDNTDLLNYIAAKYNLPVFKNAVNDDYTLFANHLMNNVNLNDLYGNYIYRYCQDGYQVGVQEKVLYVHIPVGCGCAVNCSINVTGIVKNIKYKLYFWVLGYQYADMLNEHKFAYVNALTFNITSQPAVITVSSSSIDFGIKVSDKSFKQSISAAPLGSKQLYQEILLLAKEKANSKDVLLRYLPYLNFLANSGLFSVDATLVNTTASAVRFCIIPYKENETMCDDAIFTVNYPFGLIKPFDTMQIRFFFSPNEVGSYFASVSVYYTSNGTNQFFIDYNYLLESVIYLQLSGVAVHRNLVFDNYIHFFPNTAINSPSRIFLNIFNVGYKQNTRLSVYFPPELSKIAFNIIWPFGNVINHMIRSLPIIISFISAFPISFNSRIAILDENNVPYYINIAGNSYGDDFYLADYKLHVKAVNQQDEMVKTISYFAQNTQLEASDYHELGYTKSYILALQSISARPLIEFSEYAVALGFDSLYKLHSQYELHTDYILVNPCQQISVDRQVQYNFSLLKSFVCGPFLSKSSPGYGQILSRLQFYFMNQFKQSSYSEVPITPFLPYLTDIVDTSCDRRLPLLLTTLQLFHGVKIGSFPQYFTQITNRYQQFLIYAANQYSKHVNYTVKQAANLPLIEEQRVKFLASAYESVVNALKINGAMLNNIHFSLLLSLQDFVAFCRANLAVYATNAFTNDKAKEPQLVNAIISQESSQLFVDLLQFVHYYCHKTAWFFVLQEIVKISVISVNKAVSAQAYVQERFKSWVLGECSEFELRRSFDQVVIKREEMVGYFTTSSQAKRAKMDAALQFVHFFAAFQLYKTDKPLAAPFYERMYSGIEIALCILSFYPDNVILAQKTREFFAVIDKINDARLQRNITDYYVVDLYCGRQRLQDLPEKLWVSFDQARKDVWKEICIFVRKVFGYTVNQDMFYSSAPSEKEYSHHIFCIHLLISVLYLMLPSLIPSKSLKINAYVGEQLNQTIEVSNAYKQTLRYDVGLYFPLDNQKSCELLTSVTSLSIEPKQTSSFEIRITPKFLKNQIFMVRMLPSLSQLRQLQLPSIIFVNVTILDRGESQAYEMEAYAGQTQRIYIPVDNIAALDVKFKIVIEEKFYPIDVTKYVNVANAKEGKSLLAIKTEKILQVKASGKAMLNVQFAPAHPGLYTARIKLNDDAVGVRTFDIKGFSLLPDASATMRMTCYVNDLRYFVIKAEELSLLEKLNSTDMLRFAVVPIGNTNRMVCNYKKEAFYINFANKAKAVPDCYLYKLIILTDNITKVYELVINILSKVYQQHIYLSCEAGLSASYVAEISNLESQPKQYQLILKGTKRDYFHVNGNQESQQFAEVAPGAKFSINIAFHPYWIADCELGVQVTDVSLGTLVMDLVVEAHGTEPREVGTIELQGKILDRAQTTLQFKNTTDKPLLVKPKFAAFQEIFRTEKQAYDVLAGEMCSIQLYAQHYVSGSYQSKLNLNLSDNTYQHYTVKFTVTPRDSSGTLRGLTKTGVPTTITAKLTNPLDETALFFVSLQNIPEHAIKCDKTVRVNGKGTIDFDMSFLPYATMKCAGIVKFSSEQCGEFWFNIELEASEAEAETLELKALIGYGVDAEVTVRNDTFYGTLNYSVSSSNMDAFYCSATKFSLNFTYQYEILVHFKPQKINEPEETIISIIGRDAKGTPVYQKTLHIRGTGMLQQDKQLITIAAQLNQGVSGHIVFKNPFLSRASVKFNYEDTEELQFTCKDQLLEPQQEVVVNYIFIPKQLQTTQNVLTILINPTWDIADAEFLPFVYVLNCIGEYTHKQPLAFLTTPARTSITKTVVLPSEIVLDDIETIKLGFEYDYPAESPFDDIQGLINTTLEATFSFSYSLSSLAYPLPHIGKRAVTFTFRPLKPFTADCMFVLQMQAGGQYKLPIYLFADYPKPEALITVELPNGHEPGYYKLECYNIKNVFTEFRAYFTPNSSQRFSVTPANGILEPGDNGIQTVHSGKLTQLLVKCENGNSIARGELVVETKDVMFVWQVVSGFRKYVPPTGVAKIADQ